MIDIRTLYAEQLVTSARRMTIGASDQYLCQLELEEQYLLGSDLHGLTGKFYVRHKLGRTYCGYLTVVISYSLEKGGKELKTSLAAQAFIVNKVVLPLLDSFYPGERIDFNFETADFMEHLLLTESFPKARRITPPSTPERVVKKSRKMQREDSGLLLEVPSLSRSSACRDLRSVFQDHGRGR